jgi:hypothetical protein
VTLYGVGGTLRIEVTDTRGDHLPHTELPAPDAESGRGLVLVDALADRWGVAPGPRPRKTVWAEIDLSPKSGNPYAGGAGGLSQRTLGRKNPDQAPPLLPPRGTAHPGG